ncbi:MAG: putative peroxiredoxin [Candidatus Anoxychlamydiales bacterium]|nr:putative peroxiredoxin [Candidatus Anoxychlamydiales bacterium]NGX36781.1 putative peroxiredoxin [Candidatus Anoxychlamydiales bacterium]
MTLVGKKAPEFKSKAVIKNKFDEDFSLSNYHGRYVIFFFYPLDFTFVCPTELHAFQEKLEAFKKKDAQVVGCSVDSIYSHFAWLDTPKDKGGIKGVEYPLVADITKNISRDYGVLNEDEGIAYRGLFLIDKEGIVRHEIINDLFLGRSVDEALRVLDALICFETHGEVCPANWHLGEKTLKPTQEGVAEYLSHNK